MEIVGFYVFAAVAVSASLLVVTSRYPMYGVLFTVVALAAVAALYILLDAPFVAVIQIIVYVGATMVLMLFAIMLLNAPGEEPAPPDLRHTFGATGARYVGAALAVVVLIEVLWAVSRLRVEARAAAEPVPDAASTASVREIGRVLFTDYTFAFEATSLLILVALIGAVVLARRDR